MSNKPISMGRETKSLAAWCRQHDVPYARTLMRLRRGRTLQEALTEAKNPPRRQLKIPDRDLIFTINGRSQNLRRWCAEYGVSYLKTWKRIDRGWEAEMALTTHGRVVDRKRLEIKRSARMLRMRFGRLRIIASAGVNKHDKGLWRCLCDCGKETIVPTGSLRNGHTTSCGCALTERRAIGNPKHGASRKRIYTTWLNMKARCENPLADGYKNYGGRGITVCKRWQSFENFYADMGDPPHLMTIDRINNNGNYEPDNCRWATKHTQSRNKRTNVVVTINGRTMVLKDWCAEYDISPIMVWSRRRRGWSMEDAITTPRERSRG